jgi:hypothetical protein
MKWQRINPGHYVTTDTVIADRFEIIRVPAGWELSDRFTRNVTITPTLKAAKATAERS